MLHKNIIKGDIHQIHNYEFADAAARLAEVVTDDDIGRVAWQQSDDSFWVLKTATPVLWIGLSGGVAPPTSNSS